MVGVDRVVREREERVLNVKGMREEDILLEVVKFEEEVGGGEMD